MRMPIRSPGATASDPPGLMLVAEWKVPAVMTVFGNPKRIEPVSGVVAYDDEIWSIPLLEPDGARNTVKSYLRPRVLIKTVLATKRSALICRSWTVPA